MRTPANLRKIDIFNHVLPMKYKTALDKAFPNHLQQGMNNSLPALWDMDFRFRIMDKFPGLMHVLTLCRPPIEEICTDPQKALDLTKLGNDEMAELVLKYPDRFPAAAAAVALNNPDGSYKELERAIVDLKFKGVQIYTDLCGKPLDSPEFMPIYEMMSKYNLPIWLHPTTGITFTDYKTEKEGKYVTTTLLGWPYETSMAMSRLVLSGILEKWPNLKVITHHSGAMIPYFEQRIIAILHDAEMAHGWKSSFPFTKFPIDYFKMLYADTAIYGNTPGLMLARAFFSGDHLMFGTDVPFSGLNGERVTRQTIDAIDAMEISADEKQKIFMDNARRLLHLAI
jgi:uncharacterized protein